MDDGEVNDGASGSDQAQPAQRQGQPAAWCTVASDGRVLDAAPDARTALGACEILFDAVASADRAPLFAAIASPQEPSQPFAVRLRTATGRWVVYRLRVAALDADRCAVFAAEITEEHRLHSLVGGQREVLDQIATRAPVATALDAVARMVEVVAPDAKVLVYLRRGAMLELAAAPSVPAAFGRAAAVVPISGEEPPAGTLAPLTGRMAEIASEQRAGFGWWATVVDELGDDLGRLVLLAGEKRFPTVEERAQCEEAVRLVAVATATARDNRRAADAGAMDALTGLLHRVALLRAAGGEERGSAVALLVDVEALRDVNERLGYDAGDVLLLSVAEQLRRTLRSRDLLGRWSGARFAVVGRSRRGDGGLATLIDRVQRSVGGAVMVSGQRIEPRCRVLAAEGSAREGPVPLLQRLEREAATREPAPRVVRGPAS